MPLLARSLSLLGSGAFLLVSLSACPGEAGGTGDGSPCSRYFDALAGRQQRCSGEELRDVAHTRERFLATCERGATAPGASGLAAQLTACADAIAQGCGEFHCEDVTGSLDDGAPCGAGFQCKSGACGVPEGATCGTCAKVAAVGEPCGENATCGSKGACQHSSSDAKCIPRRIAKAGEPCSSGAEESVDCDAGLICRATGDAEPKCEAPGKAGEACRYRSDCGDALACVEGKCGAALGEGAPCTRDECGPKLACDQTSKTCLKEIPAKDGEPCDGAVRICERGACRGVTHGTDEATTPGKCSGPLPDGADCTKDGPPCDAFASCVAGKCLVNNPAECK